MLEFNLKDILQFFYVMVFVFIGCVGRDYIDTIKDKNVKIMIPQILFWAFSISLIMLVIQSWVLTYFNSYVFLLGCVIMGWNYGMIYGFFNRSGEKIIKKADSMVDSVTNTKDKE